jgi:hypothetical protein
MRQNEKKFGPDQKAKFKKCFELYRKILVRAIMKVAENFIHYEWYVWMKVSKIQEIFNEIF